MTIPDSTIPLKRCIACGNEYPETNEFFHKHPSGVNGLRTKCKNCRNKPPRHILSPEERRERKREQDRQRKRSAKRIASNDRYRTSAEAKAHLKAYKQRPEVKERRREYDRIREANRRASGGTFTKADVEAIRKAQGNRCYLCGKKLKKYHIDHFIPLALGGTSDPGNLRLACPHCNLSKNDKHPHALGILI